ncbi:MAG: hypothetical protein ACRDFS_08330 [Chloroflexota bacterium]
MRCSLAWTGKLFDYGGALSGSTFCNDASGGSCRQSYSAYLNCLGRDGGALNCRGTLITRLPAFFRSRSITSAGFSPATGSCRLYCRGGTAYMSGTGMLTGSGLVPFSATFVDNGLGRAGTASIMVNGRTYQYSCRSGNACNNIHIR